jgi:hypothetical protein
VAERCPWKIHWGVGQESTTQCAKDEHLTTHAEHEGMAANGVTMISWWAGDRREYTGDWPGNCQLLSDGVSAPCTLHTGHHGRCAP